MLSSKFLSVSSSTPTLVSESHVGVDGSLSNTLIIPAPSGVKPGMVLVAYVSQGDSADVTWSNSDGFTLKKSVASSPSLAVFVKTATSSEPSNYTFTVSGVPNAHKGGVIVAYRDAVFDVAGDIMAVGPANATVPAISITTTSGSEVLAFFTRDYGGLNLTTPSGYTLITKYTTGATTAISWGAFRKSFPIAGSTGTVESTFSDAIGNGQGVLVSLKGD